MMGLRPPYPLLYYLPWYCKGMPKVSSKHQITIPVEAMREAGLHVGDEVVVRAARDGEIVLALRGSRIRRHAGIAAGIYEPDEVDRLRGEWDR